MKSIFLKFVALGCFIIALLCLCFMMLVFYKFEVYTASELKTAVAEFIEKNCDVSDGKDINVNVEYGLRGTLFAFSRTDLIDFRATVNNKELILTVEDDGNGEPKLYGNPGEVCMTIEDLIGEEI